MSPRVEGTRDRMIRDDTQYALEEAFGHVMKFFGSVEKARVEKGPLDFEEDQRLKEVAFELILDHLLRVCLAWTDEEVET